VLAATNHDLERLVEEGKFRKDLYYRLKVVTVHVPPLRERRDDVAELAHYFLFRFDRELGLDLRGFAPETLELLQAYDWPGNVRELQSVIKQAMLHASGHILVPEFLPEGLRRQLPAAPAPRTPAPDFDLPALIDGLLRKGERDVYARVLEAVERLLLARVLRETHGHQAQASEILGINRTTLRAKLRALGLAVDKVVTEEAPAETEPGEGKGT
jgi:two-component system, NtrC family, nitrogen regulation response regulator GlnG